MAPTTNEENKRIVADGLERRRAERQAAEVEAWHEDFERDMIAKCNAHGAAAQGNKERRKAANISRIISAERKTAGDEAIATMRQRDKAAIRAVIFYTVIVAVLFQLTEWTPFPIWGAATYTISLAPILYAYVYRLYNPLKMPREVTDNG